MTEHSKKKIVHVHLGDEKYKTTLNAGEHKIIADEPITAGGKDKGPDPYDLLLMSLGACTVITIRMYAERKKWPVEDIYMELRHFKDHARDCRDCDEKAVKIDKIEKEITVTGDLSDEQLEKLLEISKKCPVHRTLMSDIVIDSKIDLLPESKM
ncbi:MAG: OsmC family protein [Balneolaceae bacterium]